MHVRVQAFTLGMARPSCDARCRVGVVRMRRVRMGLLAAVATVCVLPAQALGHTVTGGETLSSVAAANGLTTDELAAANGLSPDALLVEGESLYVPYPSESGGGSSGGGGGETGGGGGYVVQPGDTLSGIAASTGLS